MGSGRNSHASLTKFRRLERNPKTGRERPSVPKLRDRRVFFAEVPLFSPLISLGKGTMAGLHGHRGDTKQTGPGDKDQNDFQANRHQFTPSRLASRMNGWARICVDPPDWGARSLRLCSPQVFRASSPDEIEIILHSVPGASKYVLT